MQRLKNFVFFKKINANIKNKAKPHRHIRARAETWINPSTTTGALVLACGDGCPDARRSFQAQYGPEIRSVLRRVNSSLSLDDVMDRIFASDTFITQLHLTPRAFTRWLQCATLKHALWAKYDGHRKT